MFAMLLWRSWLEIRARFVSAAVAMALLGAATVLRAPATIDALQTFHGERVSYALYVWLSLPHGYLQFTWIVAALLLAMGGLLREQALGTAPFTLSLPVPRRHLVAARAIAGAAAAAVLALIPLVLVTVLSPLAGFAFPLDQALLFAATTAGVGMVFYGFGFVLSHLFRGEYTAPAAGLAAIGVLWILTRFPLLHPYDPFAVMSAIPYLDDDTLRFVRLPLSAVVAGVGGLAAMVGASILLVRRRAF